MTVVSRLRIEPGTPGFKSPMLTTRSQQIPEDSILPDYISCLFILCQEHMSRPARKPTLLTLRKVSIPDQPKHAAQAYPDRHFSPPVYFLFQEL